MALLCALVAAPLMALVAAPLMALAAAPGLAASGDARWQGTVERVAQSVVALRVAASRPFDTESASFSVATGFVVDAERGLILTNRHVVHPGPVAGDAIFLNHEEVEITPVYRDPVHDFGFFRFDPAQVRFMEVRELQLAPEAARVGAEIRVIGNDAGEKLSILDGTLARLDRPAPAYGRGRYNDFNTFYFQAASSSSGGSSGSPVVDRRGRVVALNAGGSRGAASSFFLPLDRIVRALRAIQEGRPVDRGTIQTVFVHEPYDEVRRLGLRTTTEAEMRGHFQGGTGLLVVRETVPGGPGDGVLEPGDVLVRLNGKRAASFVAVESVLDAHVGGVATLEVERGGRPIVLEVPIQDLHAITPDAYLEMGGAVLHALSYQQARGHGVSLGGMYLASPGYAFSRASIPGRVVLTDVDGVPTTDLAALEAQLAGLAEGTRFQVGYYRLGAKHSPARGVVRIDRRWFPMRLCRRDDRVGRFPCTPSPEPPPAPPPEGASTTLEGGGSFAARRLARSLVAVSFDVPYAVDGVQGRAFTGSGLIVDAERGLVVVDRDTVPVTLGDVRLTFGGSVQVPGEGVGFHPEHNVAVVRYEPELLGDTPLVSARLRDVPLETGDDVWLVAMTNQQQVLSLRTQVSRVDSATIRLPRAPRFRETNSVLIALADTLPSVGGVLADRFGRVLALWESFSTQGATGGPSSFFAGLPIHHARDLVAPLLRGEALSWRSLGVELGALPLARARDLGLAAEDAARLAEHAEGPARALVVRRVARGTPAATRMRPGDLLLAADGRPLTAFRAAEEAGRAAEVALTVLRQGRQVDLVLPTVERSTAGTRRAILWAGTLLQEPPEALAWQRGLTREGVYVAGRWRGSPADRYKLAATRRILAVDGQPVPDLDAFLRAVGEKGEGDSVRLRTADLQGKVRVLTLQLHPADWPTMELRWQPEGWVREAPARR
ncbi:MAG: hypothetical protein CL910_09225 [Deltaproteobacteria bacterium]|nr:hypothetical protein [Deltaproteobacteria bacterium]